MLAAWILFKTQLDIIESMVRSLTDIVWTGSKRVRALSRGDVRVVYYAALGLVCLWGIFALRLAQPIILLMLAANIAGMVFTIAAIHLLYLNTRLLRKNCARRCGAAWRLSACRCSTDSSRCCPSSRSCNHEGATTKARRPPKTTFNTETRSAVDFDGRTAAIARERTNVKYKTPKSSTVLYFSSCILAARLWREVGRCHRVHLRCPQKKGFLCASSGGVPDRVEKKIAVSSR